jgi:hypothetical protein
MLSLDNVTNSIFQNSSSVEMIPVVSAEWNQNLFNQPYITVAGTGSQESLYLNTTSGTNVITSVTDITGQASAMQGVTTKTFNMSVTGTSLSYTINTANSGSAYKIITYMKTNASLPIMVNAYAKGSSSQYGSTTVDINEFGYIKVLTYIGSSGVSDGISSFVYTINLSTYNSTDISSGITVYYTQPEVFQTTYFDYQNHSLWPTDSVFSHFRPGESYVPSGNQNFSFPSNFRQITTQTISGVGTTYPPITPIIQNPGYSLATPPVPLYKNALPSDMAPYKYFVSDPAVGSYHPSISGIYQPGANANKLVIKFNTISSTPTVNVILDSTTIATGIQPDASGLLVLYYNGSSWSTNKWSTMPVFNSNGYISNYASFNKITITQTSYTLKSAFASYSSSYVAQDASRMHLVEISPRIEVDLSDYVMELDINKQLDSKNNYIPISSINPNDASVTLSAIPLTYNNGPIPIFSSQSNLPANILYNMMRKNIKFYFGFKLLAYFTTQEIIANPSHPTTGRYIPGGVYYSNSWDETDIQTVKISCYDIVNYLQMVPVPDYVASNKSIFDIITNILDLAGFTDYDYDSLYQVCNDASSPIDMYYYFCNSQSATVYDALSELFLSHQIGAYIDEYGVMKFLSLTKIMRDQSSIATFTDASIIQGGYSITNKAKPGMITISYQEPKVLQSLALQNATDISIQNSPSFIYTTSNDVVWSQKNSDSNGYNYLSTSMNSSDNFFTMNNNDLLDIFHTYSLNNNGYAVIEDEVVSFLYKEYRLEKYSDSNVYEYVYPKSDIELSSYVNSFVKKHQAGLITNDGSTKNKAFDVKVTPTGKISNVQRGMFGTVASDHLVISPLHSGVRSSNKNLTEATLNSSYAISLNSSTTSVEQDYLASPDNPQINKIQITPPSNGKTLVYSNTVSNPGFRTYSAKFDLNGVNMTSGGVFFNLSGGSTANNAYFVELVQVNTYDPSKTIEGGGGLEYFYYNPPKFKYYLVFYQVINGTPNILAWSDATGTANFIRQNFEKVLYINAGKGTSNYSYAIASDQSFNLRVVNKYYDGTNGETQGQNLEVFLNNVQVTGWQIPALVSDPSKLPDTTYSWLVGGDTYVWGPTSKNTITGLRQKVNFIQLQEEELFVGTKFGFFSSLSSVLPYGITGPNYAGGTVSANLREIYASEKALIEKSVNYYYQDREFLNGLVQSQNLFAKYKSYMMQSNPDVVGINYYDVQYQTPAATSVNVLPIEYLMFYFPGTQPIDQQYYQSQLVDEYSLAYSTPINTGFRARMAIVNNCGHMVYLNKQADATVQTNVVLNLWTHEVIAPSDPQVIQRVLDPANISEVIQVDSPWIQSKESANKLIDVIKIGNDGFSKDTSIQIFGNPMVQVGDILTVYYGLAGISGEKYLVHEVAHTFKNGLKTTLTLNSLSSQVGY